MKTFAKRAAITTGVLLTALVCVGFVYIDNVKHYWQFSGGFVRLVVNTNALSSMTVNTNTLTIGFNTNNSTHGLFFAGRVPATNLNTPGGDASALGGVRLSAAQGGSTLSRASGVGGAGGTIAEFAGQGGFAQTATTNNTGGQGGSFSFAAGLGGNHNDFGGNYDSLATNQNTGGAGGSFSVTAGGGGTPGFGNSGIEATNTVGGDGGALSFTAGAGGLGFAGWAAKGGNGGGFTMLAGAGGSAVRTNGGNGGAFSLTAGNAGSSSTGGNPGNPGEISLTAGNGAAGLTNSNGGRVHLVGGTPGSGAVPGDVVIGRTAAGAARGGVQIGPLIVGGSATITNILGASASLDFGSVAAGTVFDLPITVTGVTSNNVAVSLSVPWQSASGGGSFTTFNSNDAVYVRFVNNNLMTAIDPNPGQFVVVGFRIR